MKCLRYIFVVAAWFASGVEARGAPARFWISAAVSPSLGSIERQVPTLNAAEGRIRYLHIWAQPATVLLGPYHATTNPFRTLQGFSLNLVSAGEPIVDFLDQEITVHNPTMPGGVKRFQFVFDSTSPEECLAMNPPSCLRSNASATGVESGTLDGIGGMPPIPSGGDIQGFSIGSASYTGISPDPVSGGCRPGDLCEMTSSGPAWLVASIGFQTVASSGSASAYLQIGYNGMLHSGNSSHAEFEFGVNDPQLQPTYNSATERQLHNKNGELPDVFFQAIPFTPGDYDGDGMVGRQDYNYWRSSFGQSVMPGTGADGNGDGKVDAADYVLWRSLANLPLAGDYDGNGRVGHEDYVQWRASFSQSVTHWGSGADGNGDGMVDASDYVLWRKHFSASGGTGAAVGESTPSGLQIVVPEPNGRILALLCAVFILRAKRLTRGSLSSKSKLLTILGSAAAKSAFGDADYCASGDIAMRRDGESGMSSRSCTWRMAGQLV